MTVIYNMSIDRADKPWIGDCRLTEFLSDTAAGSRRPAWIVSQYQSVLTKLYNTAQYSKMYPKQHHRLTYRIHGCRSTSMDRSAPGRSCVAEVSYM